MFNTKFWKFVHLFKEIKKTSIALEIRIVQILVQEL